MAYYACREADSVETDVYNGRSLAERDSQNWISGLVGIYHPFNYVMAARVECQPRLGTTALLSEDTAK